MERVRRVNSPEPADPRPVPRLISFAGSTVALEWSGETAAGIASFLFSGFPPPPPEAAPPLACYRLLPGVPPGSLVLTRDGIGIAEGRDAGTLAERWLGAVSHELAWHSRGGLLLHAGALALPGTTGGCAILPGGIGAGKTTLVLHLARRGLGYCSDEMVYLPTGAPDAVPCLRPLNLKRGSFAAVGGVVDLTPGPEILANAQGCLIDPARLGPAALAARLPVRLLLFPRFETGAAFSLAPLGRALAGLELMQCLVNARNLPEHGFPEAACLASTVPAWSLRYSAFDQLGPLEKLLGLRRAGAKVTGPGGRA